MQLCAKLLRSCSILCDPMGCKFFCKLNTFIYSLPRSRNRIFIASSAACATPSHYTSREPVSSLLSPLICFIVLKFNINRYKWPLLCLVSFDHHCVFWDSSILLHAPIVSSETLLYNIPLYKYIVICLSILLRKHLCHLWFLSVMNFIGHLLWCMYVWRFCWVYIEGRNCWPIVYV